MTWKKAAVDSQAVRELARRYEIDLLTATILTRRGIVTPDAVRFFLETDSLLLHNPFLMPAMADAVERINAAIDSGERILIFGDRDVDGITATVLLFEALVELGAEATWVLPEGEEMYGLSESVIEKTVEAGASLLITVDCGVSNASEIGLAAARGIDTIVIDHHNPPGELPSAFSVVDPKLPGYPFRDLSGCAVASKVEWALRFSRSPFFGPSFCLLNARPANDTIMVDAVRVTNLVETGRLGESFVPGLVPFEKSRLYEFIGPDEPLVLDADAQSRLLSRAFGRDVSVSLSDVSSLVAELLPALSGKSLLRIQQESRSARYEARQGSEYAEYRRSTEIDALRDLFSALILKKEEARLAPVFSRLDLVTLGTLADLMPLTDENRVLVRMGLERLRSSDRSGLIKIFSRKDLLGKRIRATDIAWQIAPLLNSAGRMGEPGTATSLLLSRNPEEADALVDQLFSLDQRRKALGETTWNLVVNQARECMEKTMGKCVLVHDERVPRGITGIMASRLQGFFKAPAIVISVNGDAAVGSIRSNRAGFIADLAWSAAGFRSS